jgi:hypothetical protein
VSISFDSEVRAGGATASGTARGTPYSLSFTPSGGTPPYTVALASNSSMPPGLAFSGVTLSGTPSAPGGFTVSVVVTDSSTPPVSFTKSQTIYVDSPLSPAPYTSVDQSIVQFNYTLGGPLPGREHLDAVAARREQPENEQAKEERLRRIVRRFGRLGDYVA